MCWTLRNQEDGEVPGDTIAVGICRAVMISNLCERGDRTLGEGPVPCPVEGSVMSGELRLGGMR